MGHESIVIQIHIQGKKMQNYVFVEGKKIYEAAVEGAKRGYSMSTNDYSIYEEKLDHEYELLIKNCTSNKRKQRQIRLNTNNSWKKAIIPLQFLMYHEKIERELSEKHVRVMLQETMTVFDISNESWEKLIAESH
jgi:hypothetical protein